MQGYLAIVSYDPLRLKPPSLPPADFTQNLPHC